MREWDNEVMTVPQSPSKLLKKDQSVSRLTRILFGTFSIALSVFLAGCKDKEKEKISTPPPRIVTSIQNPAYFEALVKRSFSNLNERIGRGEIRLEYRDELLSLMRRIRSAEYKAIRKKWEFDRFKYTSDYVQADKMTLREKMLLLGWSGTFKDYERRIAPTDFIVDRLVLMADMGLEISRLKDGLHVLISYLGGEKEFMALPPSLQMDYIQYIISPITGKPIQTDRNNFSRGDALIVYFDERLEERARVLGIELYDAPTSEEAADNGDRGSSLGRKSKGETFQYGMRDAFDGGRGAGTLGERRYLFYVRVYGEKGILEETKRTIRKRSRTIEIDEETGVTIVRE